MKLKEQLMQMGLTEEQTQKVIDEVVDGNFILKSRFNEINEENKALKKPVSDRDRQLRDLTGRLVMTEEAYFRSAV